MFEVVIILLGPLIIREVTGLTIYHSKMFLLENHLSSDSHTNFLLNRRVKAIKNGDVVDDSPFKYKGVIFRFHLHQEILKC